MASGILSSLFIRLQLIGVRVLAAGMPARRTFFYDIRDRHSFLKSQLQPHFLRDTITRAGRFDITLIAIFGV